MTEDLADRPIEPPAARPGASFSPVLYLLIFVAGMSFSLLGALLPDIS